MSDSMFIKIIIFSLKILAFKPTIPACHNHISCKIIGHLGLDLCKHWFNFILDLFYIYYFISVSYISTVNHCGLNIVTISMFFVYYPVLFELPEQFTGKRILHCPSQFVQLLQPKCQHGWGEFNSQQGTRWGRFSQIRSSKPGSPSLSVWSQVSVILKIRLDH